MSKQQYGTLDLFRLLAAVMVMAIHTAPLESVNSELDYIFGIIIPRVAVPFFFMVSGQFTDFSRFFAVRKQLLKLSIMYGISILIYIPLGIYGGYYEKLTPVSVLKMLLFDGSYYHLWYFPACILGLIIVYLLKRFLPKKAAVIAAALLYIIALFGDNYFGIAERIPLVSEMYGALFTIFSFTRNGLFFAPLFLLMGNELGTDRRSESRPKLLAGMLFSLALMIAEGMTLRHFGIPRHNSMLIFLVPVMIFLYRLLLSFPAPPRTFARSVSAWAYILHPAVIAVLHGAIKTVPLLGNSAVFFVLIVMLSFAAAVSVEFILTKTGNKLKDFKRDRA